MFDNIENAKPIFSSKKDREKNTVKNRKGHVLTFRIRGYGIHDFGKKTIKSFPGSILFIPEGSSYMFEPYGDTPCHSVSITFLADIKSPEPTIFDGSSFPNALNTFLNMYKYFHLQTPDSKYLCVSLLYSVFAYMARQERAPYCNNSKALMIQPVLDYIKEHLYNANLKTDLLHTYCGVSAAYFRRIFKANMRQTPQKYIEEKRLEHALFLINESAYSISKISEMVGYNDPLYFGSVFKKKYGISPSHMRQFGHP